MKKLKRIFSALLIGAMALTLLVGCGGSGSTFSSVQYIGEGTTILENSIKNSDSWTGGDTSISIIDNEALRSLTETWAKEASLALPQLCDPQLTDYADKYLRLPFEVRCGDLLIKEGIIGEGDHMDISVQVLNADNYTRDELNVELATWLKDNQGYIQDNQTPKNAALHVYSAINPLDETQKAWVVFMVVTGPKK